jgi:hypothetical protein
MEREQIRRENDAFFNGIADSTPNLVGVHVPGGISSLATLQGLLPAPTWQAATAGAPPIKPHKKPSW